MFSLKTTTRPVSDWDDPLAFPLHFNIGESYTERSKENSIEAGDNTLIADLWDIGKNYYYAYKDKNTDPNELIDQEEFDKKYTPQGMAFKLNAPVTREHASYLQDELTRQQRIQQLQLYYKTQHKSMSWFGFSRFFKTFLIDAFSVVGVAKLAKPFLSPLSRQALKTGVETGIGVLPKKFFANRIVKASLTGTLAGAMYTVPSSLRKMSHAVAEDQSVDKGDIVEKTVEGSMLGLAMGAGIGFIGRAISENSLHNISNGYEPSPELIAKSAMTEKVAQFVKDRELNLKAKALKTSSHYKAVSTINEKLSEKAEELGLKDSHTIASSEAFLTKKASHEKDLNQLMRNVRKTSKQESDFLTKNYKDSLSEEAESLHQQVTDIKHPEEFEAAKKNIDAFAEKLMKEEAFPTQADKDLQREIEDGNFFEKPEDLITAIKQSFDRDKRLGSDYLSKQENIIEDPQEHEAIVEMVRTQLPKEKVEAFDSTLTEIKEAPQKKTQILKDFISCIFGGEE